MLATGIPADVLLRQTDDVLATIMDIYEERSKERRAADSKARHKAGKG